ncbi:MAG: peptide-methionine (S)-S-oxide reductase MsrA [Bdellovibrionales bacterium]|nr:peptide-methionine (S)-S-oxide reductase MsrA [Bdellovibrionales bacterium]
MKRIERTFLSVFLVCSVLVVGGLVVAEELAPQLSEEASSDSEAMAVAAASAETDAVNSEEANSEEANSEEERGQTESEQPLSPIRVAIFAGGCFWCMEPPFDETPGVLETISGYTGGTTVNPTYLEVSEKATGHYEALKVTYDSRKVSYEDLLKVYWRNIDPFDAEGQFCDKGSQYKSVIFVANDEERALAKKSLEEAKGKAKEKGTFATQILPQKEFYDAEEYHQNYYQKNKLRYKFYRHNCGRDKRLEEIWGMNF